MSKRRTFTPELKARGIAKVTGKTVSKIFDRLGLPVRIYALMKIKKDNHVIDHPPYVAETAENRQFEPHLGASWPERTQIWQHLVT